MNEKESRLRDKTPLYSFSITNLDSAGRTVHHIRRLTDKGQMLGGGADSLSLCGRIMSADMSLGISVLELRRGCSTCALKYTEILASASDGTDDMRHEAAIGRPDSPKPNVLPIEEEDEAARYAPRPMSRDEVKKLEANWLKYERINHLDGLKIIAHIHYLELQLDRFSTLVGLAKAMPGGPENVSADCRGICGLIAKVRL